MSITSYDPNIKISISEQSYFEGKNSEEKMIGYKSTSSNVARREIFIRNLSLGVAGMDI